MPRDGLACDVADTLDPLTALPAWVKGEKRLSSMLPYVSLVTDRTIRTRGNELMQCIRLEGVNCVSACKIDPLGGVIGVQFWLCRAFGAVDPPRRYILAIFEGGC